MLYELFLNYVEHFTFLNVFKYITFRSGLAFFTSLLIALLIGGPFIRLFSNRKIFNPIREDGPSDHIVKKIGTPTMGGVIILIAIIVSVLFWADLKNIYILFCLYIVTAFGLLGAYDDYKKIRNISSSGISFKFKIITQIILAFLGLLVLTYFVEYEEFKNLYFPF
ncbi:phospho-N-acetylmuramoyl-pentapeptide-transferase, partial [Pelagibacterales bacterium SAG-MED39]|nr:phospho-N-acetylmuramoyl-pentapeptide-transferase [Pelagibacterales bacterium SAG-MED39]